MNGNQTKQEYTPPTKTCGRYKFNQVFGKDIEQYQTIQRAIEGIQESTKDSYLRVLPHYFIHLGLDPDQVIDQRKKDLISLDVTENERFERKTAAFIKTMLDKGRTGAATTSRMRIQGFFANNSKRLALDMPRSAKIPKGRKRKKYSPSKEEVRKLLEAADCARDKLIITLMFQTGAAPVDIANLCCGDLPLTAWTYAERSRSKTGETWRVVTTPDIVDSYKAYMAVRGETGAYDPLFVGREGVLDNRGISQVVAEVILKAGYSNSAGFVPKCLRDAFEDALADAEIYKKTKETMMGHMADIEQEYGSYKKMQQRLVEAMQKVYPLICLNEHNLERKESADYLTPEEVIKVRSIIDGIYSGKYKITRADLEK